MPLGSAALTVKQRRYVGHIHSSGEHLLALVSDILDLAKVGAGQIEVNLEEVAVHAEVQDPVDKMRPLAARKGLTIEVDVPLELTSFTDRLRVRQIILNLLSNAVKFTPPEGGPIRVTGTVSGEGIEIAVADSGIGIALEEQVRIFDEFTQVDRGPSRRLDGTGLGLTLTKKMAEIVGGSVRVASKLGHGSTFTVWLPGVVARGDARPLRPRPRFELPGRALGPAAPGADPPHLFDLPAAHAYQLVGKVHAGAHVEGIEGDLLAHREARAGSEADHPVLLRAPGQRRGQPPGRAQGCSRPGSAWPHRGPR